jgi:hypothetical protein
MPRAPFRTVLVSTLPSASLARGWDRPPYPRLQHLQSKSPRTRNFADVSSNPIARSCFQPKCRLLAVTFVNPQKHLRTIRALVHPDVQMTIAGNGTDHSLPTLAGQRRDISSAW